MTTLIVSPLYESYEAVRWVSGELVSRNLPHRVGLVQLIPRCQKLVSLEDLKMNVSDRILHLNVPSLLCIFEGHVLLPVSCALASGLVG